MQRPFNPMKSTQTFLMAGCVLAAALAAPSIQAQTFTFSTLAGGAPGSANGVNSAAEFNTPTGAAVDAAGNVYAADQGNNLIREISPLGTNWVVTTLAGSGPGSLNGSNTAAEFYGPTGVALDKAGNLYVADQYNNIIRMIVPSGTNWIVSTIAGTARVTGGGNGLNGAASFSNPTGLAVDGAGNVFVADELNNAVRKIAPSGTNWVVTTIAGGSQGANDGSNSAAQFFNPTGVAVDANGRVYVADQFNNTIRLITPVGTNWVVTTIAGQTISGFANGLGTNALFDAPTGLAVDTNGNVYVADMFNNALRKLAPSGTNWLVSTIGGGADGTNNGVGTNAGFNLPFGVAADAYGDVFAADSQNNTIRMGVSGLTPATGGLSVAMTPAGAVSAGAEWQVDGGAWHANGVVLTGIAPGNHAVGFSTVAGYTTPAWQTVPVTARQTNHTTANYTTAISNAGSLQVTISPAGSVAAGAQWRVDAGAWQTNAAIVAGLSVGNHILAFSSVSGWTTPAGQTVAVTNSETTPGAGTYVFQTGSLRVTIYPAAVVSAGAQWQVDGGAWQASGATLSGLPPGSHTVGFVTALGWVTPVNQPVTITNTLTTSAAATYAVYTANPPAQLTGMTFAGGKFRFVLNGNVGSNYVIQTSSNLVAWTSIATNTIPAGGAVTVTDSNAVSPTRRYYRAVNP